ncbi:hypothetical protein GE21DRAFT_9538 [Neurospora crassa]|uniref:BTB domain-containing protein n=1 Tax=Neurospora crassa (strain ATCC 24698 / 74-OR23-1A / CBS 708.71 / DSM 1257 / FGSC 987) TaxID=367110 RepID=A7UW15_NEUCR|nr:hypothetical protein NCU10911 [Neurospora crassa OR74A]EDO65356.2 hypothetical protein NCU10911 [Neurospora crassa OR74A]KHE83856.1 hypothetical protein GE21DRAFT_9538 [Neurospora crassa]|eukprot:XP_001728447.2 hypothetical protein NCU10911 [Neurospora crassa OR74A]
MDPSRPLGIKSEPVESSHMTTIPQAIRQAAPAIQSAFTAATLPATDSITVATTSAATTAPTTAAKAPPAKKATAAARKPAAAKKEAAVKTPAVPKTASAAKATPKTTPKAPPKATPKATPKTAAAKATPTTNTQAEAEVTPPTTTGTGTARPRGRPKKNANATDAATTAAAANDNTNITDTAKASISSPPPAAPSSPIIVATANRPTTATATANRLIPSPSPSPGPGPAPATATTTPAGRPTTTTRGRGRGTGRGTGRGRGRGRGRGGASTSRASSSTTTPARKRTASAASIADADADTDPDDDDDVDADAYGRASKQRKVASAEGIAATLRAFEASRAGSASALASGAGSGSGSKQVVRAAASGGAGGSGGNKGAAGPGTSVGKKGWSVDGQEINRRHKENDLHLLETGEFSDATIHCLKKKWKVHKMRLSTRSAWFREAFAGSDGTGQISEINLHEQNAEDIETMLRFMYADSLDDNLTRPSSLASPITTYVTLYNLGHTFRIPLLCRDSITLLGQYLDTKLLLLCTYSVPASGRSGVIDHSDPLLSPQSYANDLFSAIFQAYSGVSESTKLHSLLASFLWAGRDRLFRLPGLRQVVDQCPMLGTDVFKLQLGDNSSSFIPPTTIKLTNVPGGGGGGGGGDVEELKAKHFGPTCSRLDHTRKTQHPDRCEACDEVFDEERWAKRVYNPFKVVVRPAAWCRRCVEGKTNPNAPGGGKGGKGGIGGRFDLGVGGPVVVDGDGEGEGAEGGNGERHRRKGVLEDVVPMWRLRVGGDDE